VNRIPAHLKSVHDQAGTLFTVRWNQRSRWPGKPVHHEPEYADSATSALAQPEEARASPQQTREDKRKIKELERDLRRKEKALAEAAALLVLAKKVSAIFHKEEDE